MKALKAAAAFGAIMALATAGTAVAQQRHSTEWRTKPAKDRYSAAHSVEAARDFADYTRCIAENRTDRARLVVLAPYASDEQERLLDRIIVRGRRGDNCIRVMLLDQVRMRFRPETFAGGIAQALVLKDYPDLPAIVGRYQTSAEEERAAVAKLNAAEAFGRCVVRRDPGAALALLSSRTATPDERQAVNALRDDLPMCLSPGDTIKINEMFLRNTMAVAGYRLARQVEPRGEVATGS